MMKIMKAFLLFQIMFIELIIEKNLYLKKLMTTLNFPLRELTLKTISEKMK
jgi:hypothetical protein